MDPRLAEHAQEAVVVLRAVDVEFRGPTIAVLPVSAFMHDDRVRPGHDKFPISDFAAYSAHY